MLTRRVTGATRRQLVAAGAALAATGLARLPAAAAPPHLQLGLGIAGGGRAQMTDGTAEFAVVATRIRIEGADQDLIIGHVRWVDPGWEGKGISFESVAITSYGPVPNQQRTAEARGVMQVGGGDQAPFTLRAVDVGPPGDGKDKLKLTVGDPALNGGFRYVADATVVVGDIELVDFTAAVAAPGTAEPTPVY